MNAGYFETRCDIHGKVEGNDKANLRRIVVGIPRNRRQRYNTGCPVCRIEEKEKEAKNREA